MAPRLVHPFCHSSWLLPTDRHTRRPFRICGSGPYLMLCIVTQPHKYCAAINIEIFETEFALVFVATKVWRYRWWCPGDVCTRVCDIRCRHLVPRLYKLPVEVVGSRLTKLLLSRFVVINSAACMHLMPHLLTPASGR